ncbi:MAG: hypothetical protein FWG66_11085 [Spirochaetes bacterium]|nr:hypothetical protein [Spirochaetota bacterium]
MVKLDVTVNSEQLKELLETLSAFHPEKMPGTKTAVLHGASLIREAWLGYAKGGSLPGVESLKNPQGGYARSIKKRRLGPLSYEIYSEAPIAEMLEKGTSPFDMKKTHTKGPRSRVSKEGHGYLIVPFRWGTPGTVGFRNVMAGDVLNIVRKFEKMSTERSADDAPDRDKTPNAMGKMVGRAQYSKGYGRLSGAGLADQNMAGMVRAHDEAGKNRASGYFTFRVISAKGRPGSWINPGIKARPVTQTVADITREPVSKLIETAMKGDLGI